MTTTIPSNLSDFVYAFESAFPALAVGLPQAVVEQSDEKLLELFQCGTAMQRNQAFSALFNRYAKDVWRFIMSRGLDEFGAKDVFMETWMAAMDALPSFEWRGVPLREWLVRTAKNKCLECFREAEICASLDEDEHREALEFLHYRLQLDVDPSPAPPPAVQAEANQLLERVIGKLKPQYRHIIHLVYYGEKNSTEIGKLLNMRSGTVRVNHKRALVDLRKLWEELR